MGDRFRLVERAGAGASGLVYRAVDETTGREVAIKISSGTGEIASEERFQREIRILADLDSPHVVRYVGDGRDEEGRPFLAVEWLEGEDLAKRLRREPLSGPELKQVLMQAALGLAALHRRGVVHRDVKPANLFLTEVDGALKVTVIDLGVAFWRVDPGMTLEGTMIGTPHYMSPEQVLGSGVVTPATDVFSLGVVAFELVAGTRPYRAGDTFGVVAKIALEDPPRLSSVFPDVDPALDGVVARAMAKSPADRFASAVELAVALEALPSIATRARDEEPSDQPTQPLSAVALSTAERRVVTGVLMRSRSDVEADATAALFERLVAEHGGAAHRLLSRVHVALFGGSRSTGDESERAARAGLALREAFPGRAIAIATGRALADSPAQPGDVVDRCAAIAARAAPGTVRVDEVTARMLADRFDCGGAGADIVLYGERQPGATLRTFLGRETPCVGRDREVAALRALYAEVVSTSSPRVAVVVGEAGVGKSRLRLELLRRVGASDSPARTIFGRASAMTEGSPFGLVGAAIRGLARIALDEPVTKQREKLAATVRKGGEAAFIPLLAQIASIHARPATEGRDGVLETDRLKAAFEAWLRDLASLQPIVLVLEDLHWGDAPSIALVDSALGNLRSSPILVLAMGRPSMTERFPSLFSVHEPELVDLGKLPGEAAKALARATALDRLTGEQLEAIVARADGNAFYLEELVRAARDGGLGPELPDTVLGMVQARLDGLGADAKRYLKASAVLGEALWPSAVARLLGERREDAQTALDVLVAREVLERRPTSRFVGEPELAFRHALLRDAAYELVVEQDRAVAHLRAAEWLEERGETDAVSLARHFERGQSEDRAIPHWERASAQALSGSDFVTAIDCAERARAAGASGSMAGRCSLLVAEASRWRGDLERALESATAAANALPSGSRLWFGAMRERIAALGRLGRREPIGALAAETLAARAQQGARSAQLAALVPAAVHALYSGELEAAEALAAQIMERAGDVLDLEPLARARLHQLNAALAPARDDLQTAIEEHGLARDEFERIGDLRAATLAASNQAFCLNLVGQYERAEVVLRGVLAAATRLGLGTIGPLAMQNLGVALSGLRRHEEAREVQSRARDLFAAQKDPRLEAASRLYLARCLLDLGELDAAAREVAPVLSSSFEPMQVGAHAVTAAIRRRQGDIPAAVEHASSAISLLSRLGAVEDLELFARLVHAELMADDGRLLDALSALETARDRLVARAANLRDPELRRTFLDRVEEHARILKLTSP